MEKSSRPERAAVTRAQTHSRPGRGRKTHELQDELVAGAAGYTSPERQQRSLELAVACARISDDHRGRDIRVLDMRGLTAIVDYFVLVSTSSRRQASAIAFEIDAAMKSLGEKKLGMEGVEEGRWILVDYGDFVVHIFSEDARSFYDLDSIWGDGPDVDWVDPDKPRANARLA